MLAEVLLVLSGHPSAFFIPSPLSPSAPTTLTISPSLSAYLHPGEVASLNNLGQLAYRYRFIRTWALNVQARSRTAVLHENLSRKGKEKASPEEPSEGEYGAYFSTLVSGILAVLREYEILIVETETRILDTDPSLVQDGKNHVPLSSLIATFDNWQPILAALEHLVNTISSPPISGETSWTPGTLIHYLTSLCSTGNPRLKSIYTTLLQGLRQLFLTHLVAFMLFGLAPQISTSASPALGLDIGPDPLSPLHRVYELNLELIPPGMGARTRESMLYVGRVAATLKREGKGFPVGLIAGLREDIMGVEDLEEDGGLEVAVKRARAEVGE